MSNRTAEQLTPVEMVIFAGRPGSERSSQALITHCEVADYPIFGNCMSTR